VVLEVMLMPRKAREKIPYGTYEIEQRGVPGKRIFESDEDRAKFLDLLLEKKRQFNFKIYGVMIHDETCYRLVVYDHGSDISKIMKSINISLSYLLKDRGRVFKDRYRSTLIKTPEALTEVLKAFKPPDPVLNHGISLKALIDTEIIFTLADSHKEQILVLDPETHEVCMREGPHCENTADCIRSYEKGQEILQEIAGEYGLALDDFLANKALRNEALLKFRKKTTLSLKDIGLLFGGLSESAVCKIISRTK
jgi:hypothetical protein